MPFIIEIFEILGYLFYMPMQIAVGLFYHSDAPQVKHWKRVIHAGILLTLLGCGATYLSFQFDFVTWPWLVLSLVGLCGAARYAWRIEKFCLANSTSTKSESVPQPPDSPSV